MDPKQQFYHKRGQVLVKNLQSRHFEAYYCETKDDALSKALELIPKGASVGWGGALSAQQIGLMDALSTPEYHAIDRDKAKSPEEREQAMRDCFSVDFFITGANGISLDGQMVNVDGNGNRVGAIIYGPKHVLVIAGMNKVVNTVDDALHRARTIAAPLNKQRFPNGTPCDATGSCADCKAEGSICNQVVITRNCRPAGRIKFILVGEDLGF